MYCAILSIIYLKSLEGKADKSWLTDVKEARQVLQLQIPLVKSQAGVNGQIVYEIRFARKKTLQYIVNHLSHRREIVSLARLRQQSLLNVLSLVLFAR